MCAIDAICSILARQSLRARTMQRGAASGLVQWGREEKMRKISENK